jgi:hypothetical protein
VRASLRENGEAYYSLRDFDELFKESDRLERLALFRNTAVPNMLVRKIFDIDNNEFGIESNHRTELALAFLTNGEAIVKAKEHAGLKLSDWMDDFDGLGRYEALKFLNDLWLLASKWPIDTTIPAGVYRNIPADDETKASVFQTCSDRFLKRFILESCDGSETTTLQLGMKDSDDDCRSTALEKCDYLDPGQLKDILEGKDEHALRGLISNRSLFIASCVANRVFRPKGWYSISLDRLKQMGAGRWYELSNSYQLNVLLGRGLSEQLRKMIFNRSDYLWEKKFPTHILTLLRKKLWDRLKEFDKVGENFDWQFAPDRKELEKTLPPSDPDELFDPFYSNGGNLVKPKVDFIGWKLLTLESLIERRTRFLKRIILITLFIWLVWKLLGFFT